jgi:glycosyltransferase involved in cell wall biosynthesis
MTEALERTHAVDRLDGGAPARVLFVDHTQIIGGAQLVLGTHIAALDRSRWTPLVACTDAVPMLIDRYREAGAEVLVMPMPRLRRLSPAVIGGLFKAARHLRRLVRENAVDLVVANTSRAAYIAAVALVGSSVPLVWWVRDFLFSRPVFHLLRSRAARIICVSRAIREFYSGGTDPRFAVVHVGSPLAEALAGVTDDDVRAERARWGLGEDDVVVGFMGRLVDDKGAEDVVEAVALARAVDPRLRLLVAGSGRGQPGDVEDALRRRAGELDAGAVVVAGFQRAEALYYRLFDIFVLATRTPEPYATSVVQAMMAGTPVIATATGGTPELVRDGITGLLVPPRSPRRLADAIVRVVADDGLRRRMAGAARAEVLAHNREQVTTALAERLYAEVLSTARR